MSVRVLLSALANETKRAIFSSGAKLSMVGILLKLKQSVAQPQHGAALLPFDASIKAL